MLDESTPLVVAENEPVKKAIAGVRKVLITAKDTMTRYVLRMRTILRTVYIISSLYVCMYVPISIVPYQPHFVVPRDIKVPFV
jgi:hypothetical protein